MIDIERQRALAKGDHMKADMVKPLEAVVDFLHRVPHRIYVTSEERHFLDILVEDAKKLYGGD